MTRSPSEILEVAQRLGAQLRRVSSVELAGPCPRCGGKDRFSVNTVRGLFNCRGCGVGGDAVALARHLLECGFREALEFLGDDQAAIAARRLSGDRPRQATTETREQRTAANNAAHALSVWREGSAAQSTPVETYLRSRGLALVDDLGDVIRWHANSRAMLALFRNIHTGAPQAVSRTYLDAEAQKLGRKFLGPVGSAAVMLDGFADVTSGLHVGEGVETCLAARQFGLRPCWALGSKGSIKSFPVLAGVETLTILAENDGKCDADVEACGSRWHTAGREVLINRPLGGKDLNDVVRGAA